MNNRHAYAPDWEDITLAIRESQQDKCGHCGVPNHVWIVRSSVDPVRYAQFDMDEGAFYTQDGNPIRLSEVPDEFLDNEEVFVVLTVHHIGVEREDGSAGDPDDKSDNRLDNLVALCQRCHLLADLPGNVKKRKRARLDTKRQAIADSGQSELF